MKITLALLQSVYTVDIENSVMNPVKDKSYGTDCQGVAVAEPIVGGIDARYERDVAHYDSEGVLFAMAKLVEQRDRHTAGHCERLAFSSVALGVAMGLDSASLLTLYLGGYLHDIGKISIPDAILFKPGKLTEDEWEVMRSHTVRGEAICKPLKNYAPVLPLIRSHHERMDGTGYPDRLAGDDFPLLARVIQTVDIYDALTNTRPYKDPCSRMKALEIMEEETANGWRDREITAQFVRLNHRVIAKASKGIGMSSDRSMEDSLSNLRRFLAQ
jgi:HD-GYP domain-containing protein (c-di-GMP phosphodiesterase class II)